MELVIAKKMLSKEKDSRLAADRSLADERVAHQNVKQSL
jgi:hypothetical protein